MAKYEYKDPDKTFLINWEPPNHTGCIVGDIGLTHWHCTCGPLQKLYACWLKICWDQSLYHEDMRRLFIGQETPLRGILDVVKIDRKDEKEKKLHIRPSAALIEQLTGIALKLQDSDYLGDLPNAKHWGGSRRGFMTQTTSECIYWLSKQAREALYLEFASKRTTDELARDGYVFRKHRTQLQTGKDLLVWGYAARADANPGMWSDVVEQYKKYGTELDRSYCTIGHHQQVEQGAQVLKENAARSEEKEKYVPCWELCHEMPIYTTGVLSILDQKMYIEPTPRTEGDIQPLYLLHHLRTADGVPMIGSPPYFTNAAPHLSARFVPGGRAMDYIREAIARDKGMREEFRKATKKRSLEPVRHVVQTQKARNAIRVNDNARTESDVGSAPALVFTWEESVSRYKLRREGLVDKLKLIYQSSEYQRMQQIESKFEDPGGRRTADQKWLLKWATEFKEIREARVADGLDIDMMLSNFGVGAVLEQKTDAAVLTGLTENLQRMHEYDGLSAMVDATKIQPAKQGFLEAQKDFLRAMWDRLAATEPIPDEWRPTRSELEQNTAMVEELKAERQAPPSAIVEGPVHEDDVPRQLLSSTSANGDPEGSGYVVQNWRGVNVYKPAVVKQPRRRHPISSASSIAAARAALHDANAGISSMAVVDEMDEWIASNKVNQQPWFVVLIEQKRKATGDKPTSLWAKKLGDNDPYMQARGWERGSANLVAMTIRRSTKSNLSFTEQKEARLYVVYATIRYMIVYGYWMLVVHGELAKDDKLTLMFRGSEKSQGGPEAMDHINVLEIATIKLTAWHALGLILDNGDIEAAVKKTVVLALGSGYDSKRVSRRLKSQTSDLSIQSAVKTFSQTRTDFRMNAIAEWFRKGPLGTMIQSSDLNDENVHSVTTIAWTAKMQELIYRNGAKGLIARLAEDVKGHQKGRSEEKSKYPGAVHHASFLWAGKGNSRLKNFAVMAMALLRDLFVVLLKAHWTVQFTYPRESEDDPYRHESFAHGLSLHLMDALDPTEEKGQNLRVAPRRAFRDLFDDTDKGRFIRRECLAVAPPKSLCYEALEDKRNILYSIPSRDRGDGELGHELREWRRSEATTEARSSGEAFHSLFDDHKHIAKWLIFSCVQYAVLDDVDAKPVSK